MRDPLMGIDHTSYERDSISHWLHANSVSPTTREPMQMHCLMPDYTMRRVVTALKDNEITEELIDKISKEVSSAAITSTSVNISTIGSVKPPRRSKEEQKHRKKARHKANQNAKKSALKISSYIPTI